MNIFICTAYLAMVMFNGDVVMTDKEKENLINAAWRGDLNTIREAADAGSDLNFSDESGNTLLMGAASSGNNELVKFLLSKGADAKAKNQSGETALHHAAWKGNLEMTQTLVEAGADVNAFYRANGGLTPLSCAAESGSLETVEYLVGKGADVDYENPDYGSSPLRSAAYKGHFDIFKFIADRKKNIDWQETLGYAVSGGNLDIVKYAVEEKEANPKGGAKRLRSTIIQRAAERKGNSREDQDVPMIKYLLSKGAKLEDINNGVIFPWAMENCSEDVINFFLENGVKVDPGMSSQRWPLLPAALDNGNFGLAKHLLKDTPPFFYGDLYGEPLIVYFSDGLSDSYDIVSFLIENGVNQDSYSPAFLSSVASGDLKTAKLLLDVGADINTVNEQNYNALFFTDNYETATFLISQGIKTDHEKLASHALTRFNLLRALDENAINIPVTQAEANRGLLSAAQDGNAWAASFFLSKGADVNYRKPESERKDEAFVNMTPLMMNACAGLVQPYDIMVSPETAEVLIRAGADVNAKDKTGKTALHYATGGQCYYAWIGPIPIGSRRDRAEGMHGDPVVPPPPNHTAIALLLIKSGADLNITDNDGNTPLLLSAINRNSDAMEILLQAGAKTDIKNKEGKAFFDYLDTEEGLKTVKEANLGDHIPKEAFNNAFVKIVEEYKNQYRYDKDKLAQVIALGADVNTPVRGLNALAYIVEVGKNLPRKYDFFKQLIDAGIHVNAKDGEGMGVLAFAVYKKADTDLIKLLINSGARVNDIDNSHISALTIANVSEYTEAAEILIEAGAQRDITAEWWYTLYSCWHYDDVTRFKALVDEGVNINAKTTYAVHPNSSAGFDGDGMTILMFTAQRTGDRNNEFAKKFIQWGANVNAKNNKGQTALHYLAQTRMYMDDYKEVIPKRIEDFYKLFKTAGGNIAIKDKNGKTAYDYAVVTLPPLATLIERDLQK